MAKIELKGVWTEIFDFRFFYESMSPGTLSIPKRTFQIFLKILEDIIPGVNDSGNTLFTGVNGTGDKECLPFLIMKELGSKLASMTLNW